MWALGELMCHSLTMLVHLVAWKYPSVLFVIETDHLLLSCSLSSSLSFFLEFLVSSVFPTSFFSLNMIYCCFEWGVTRANALKPQRPRRIFWFVHDDGIEAFEKTDWSLCSYEGLLLKILFCLVTSKCSHFRSHLVLLLFLPDSYWGFLQMHWFIDG